MATQYERFTFTAPVRMVWPSVITPKPAHVFNGVSYKSQFEARFLLTPDHPDLPALRSLLAEIAQSTFGKTDIKYPIELGDALADKGRSMNPPQDREFFRGMGVMTVKSAVTTAAGKEARKPTLILFAGGDETDAANYRVFSDSEREAARPFFYPGVFVKGEVSFAPYQPPMGPGITAYLNELVSLNTGEKMAGAFDPAAKYGTPTRHVGQATQVNPAIAAHQAQAATGRVPF